MQKIIRPLKIAALIALPLCAVASIFVYRTLSQELDETFLHAADSVPTRVYSRVWIVRREGGFSLPELQARLLEREYKSLKIDDTLVAGSFAVANSSDPNATTLVRIALKDFSYPPTFRTYLHQQYGDLTLGPSTLTILAKDGKVQEIWTGDEKNKTPIEAFAVEPILVAQLSSDTTEARKSVPISEIPHTLLEAIVNVEDQRFLEHAGIDPRGIARSLWANMRAGAYVQGASTITQQLIRNIYLSRSKTLTRKFKEMAMAIVLEMHYSKDIILERYLNEVYFGQAGSIAIHGVSQAAKHYFNKPLDELKLSEQALIAAVIRGPYYYSPYKFYDRAKQRQEFVLKRMWESGSISETQYRNAVREPLKLARVVSVQDRAPYFTDMVKAQLIKELPEQAVLGAGYKIFSTVDTYYQKLADTAVTQGLAKLEDNIKAVLAKKKDKIDLQLLQGALLSIEPQTNQILAMVGGRSFAESNYNRLLLMRRQVGSIFKPFVYLAALIYGKDENGQPYNAISKLEDSPYTYEFDKQVWSPKNYEGDYLGTVTLRYALANSINVPTARLAVRVGLPYIIDVAKHAGIDTPIAPLPSISLGTSELTPIEVAQAYSTFANLGVKRELTSVLMVLDDHDDDVAHYEAREEQALPLPETANLVELLRSIFTIGTAKIAKEQGFTAPAAGKTGTTNEYRDAWFAGFTPKILTVTWVGFDRDDDQVKKVRRNFKLTGAIAALPTWLQYMKGVQGQNYAEDFAYPSGTLHKVSVDLLSGGTANQNCPSGNNIVEEIFTYNNTPHFSCTNTR